MLREGRVIHAVLSAVARVSQGRFNCGIIRGCRAAVRRAKAGGFGIGLRVPQKVSRPESQAETRSGAGAMSCEYAALELDASL